MIRFLKWGTPNNGWKCINCVSRIQRCRNSISSRSIISVSSIVISSIRNSSSDGSNGCSNKNIVGNYGGSVVVSNRRFSNFFGVSVLDGLDKKKAVVDKKTRQKLGRSLVDEESSALKMLEESENGMSTQEKAAMGYLKSLEEDICTIIQETILSTKIDLPGLRKTGKNIEIRNVILNRDFSHAEAFWESDILTDFFRYSAESTNRNNNSGINGSSDNSSNSNSNSNSDSNSDHRDGESATKSRSKGLSPEKLQMFEERIKQNINQALQNKEPVFRSAIIKRLEFRRVPRVFFKPYDMKNSKQLRQHNREAIVEKALSDHEMEYGHLLSEEIKDQVEPK